MFPFASVPFWVRFFDPQPNDVVRNSAFSILEAWFWGSTILMPIGFDYDSCVE